MDIFKDTAMNDHINMKSSRRDLTAMVVDILISKITKLCSSSVPSSYR